MKQIWASIILIGSLAFSTPGWANNFPQAEIEKAINESIVSGKVPGVVVRLQKGDKVLLEKAWGSRALLPKVEPATVDTIYDLASLTKPIATSTAIAILVDQGKLKWTDKVSQHWPAFTPNGKDQITLEHLLLHTSGLIADNPISDYDAGREKALENICNLKLSSPLGEKFRYSDVNFIVLGEIVGRVSGKPLDVFCQQYIFGPLEMNDTAFGITDKKTTRTAPTEKREGRMMRGEVHDPRAYKLDGVAGHAGLFSTTSDLAKYARMVLGEGTLGNAKKGGVVILSAKTCREWTQAREIPGGHRGYGWDIDSAYSSNRGSIFPKILSFGHTGFTGTSIWIDPVHDTFQIFLSNRVHPDGKGDIQKLRNTIATHCARLVIPQAPVPRVKTGLAALIENNFAPLKGKKIGLVTNHTGRDTTGTSVVDLLHKATGVSLKLLFAPEHGIRGAVDRPVADSMDPKTGLPIVSLYGPRRKPTKEQLKGLDLLVFDIQDAGCRFYTYSSTLGNIMEAASEAGIGVMVLDRPNPIGGDAFNGPLTDVGAESFVAFHRIPTRHGLTLGELARLYAIERHGEGKKSPSIKLEIIPMQGWTREMTFEKTGLEWQSPSPNLRTLQAAHTYPGIGLVEFTNISVGRGTDRPFEWVGAPWMQPQLVIEKLRAMAVPGIDFMWVNRTPSSSVFANKPCQGIDILVTDMKNLDPLRLGLALALALQEVHGDIWQVDKMKNLLVSQTTLEMIKEKKELGAILASFQPGIAEFRARREKVLLYK
jgi:uncharacterized protein YbbC (DUF1343 family)